jgi:hypothetical protein
MSEHLDRLWEGEVKVLGRELSGLFLYSFLLPEMSCVV